MFTGIIESLGRVKKAESQGTNRTYWIESPISRELKVDQSVSHNGVCLTVTNIQGDTYETVAVAETLQKTNLSLLVPGAKVNLERAMVFNGRIDGHLVQGHVDGTGTCIAREEQNGSGS